MTTRQQTHAKKHHKPAPQDTNAAIKDAIDTINQLGKIYAEETQALTDTDTARFLSLQDRKAETAQHYQSIMSALIAKKDALSRIDPAMKDRLRKLHAHFSEISQENLRAIERMQRCTERLGNTIRNAVVQSACRDRGYSYGETGTIPDTTRRKAVSSGLCETA